MMYGLAADAVLALHAAFVLFVVFGGLFALRWRWVALVQLPAAAWGAAAEFFSLACPLTPLEQHFRRLAGEQSYAESFIEHYLEPIMYPAGLSPAIQYWLGALVVCVNAAIYGSLWLRARKPRR